MSWKRRILGQIDDVLTNDLAEIVTKYVPTRYKRDGGGVQESGYRLFGQFEGRRRTVYGTGLVHDSNYERGHLHGEYIIYYSDGSRCKYHFIRGVKRGFWYMWYSNGLLCAHKWIENGANHGPTFYWNKNGHLVESYTYLNGVLHGERFIWCSNGMLQDCTVWQNGQPLYMCTWDESGKSSWQHYHMNIPYPDDRSLLEKGSRRLAHAALLSSVNNLSNNRCEMNETSQASTTV